MQVGCQAADVKVVVGHNVQAFSGGRFLGGNEGGASKASVADSLL